MNDLQVASRHLRRRLAASAPSVITLACSIGAAAATSALLSATLLHPLPAVKAEESVVLGSRDKATPTARIELTHQYSVYQMVEQTAMFENVAAGGLWSFDVIFGTVGRSKPIYFATHDYFRTLGVPLELGRDFNSDDDLPGAKPTAVLSHRFWRESFNSDPAVIGTHIKIELQSVLVMGVADRRFHGLTLAEPPALFMPLHTIAAVARDPKGNFNFFGESTNQVSPSAWLSVIGRLRPRSERNEALVRLTALDIETLRGRYLELIPANTAAIPVDAWPAMAAFARLLSATVGILLLIGCLTVGMVMLLRVEASRRDLAICLALGATPKRLVSRY